QSPPPRSAGLRPAATCLDQGTSQIPQAIYPRPLGARSAQQFTPTPPRPSLSQIAADTPVPPPPESVLAPVHPFPAPAPTCLVPASFHFASCPAAYHLTTKIGRAHV